MTLYFLDPNLSPSHGHHLDWDLLIAQVARARGEEVVIFAHRTCAITEKDGVAIIPWFSHSCYETKSNHPFTGKFDDFRYFNDALLEELRAIPHARFTAADCILVPTLTENHLLGYVAWMKEFNSAHSPLFIVHLMFPCGLAVSRTRQVSIADQQQASFYGLAFQRAAEPGPEIHFFGGGRQLAREFAALSGLPIVAHPIPWRPIEKHARTENADRPKALLYAGDAKADKGFTLVPPVADKLSAIYPNWDFVVHANADNAWGVALDSFHVLEKLVRKHKNLQIHAGRLTRENYELLLDQADCMVFTYDPIVYARKSSGVLWEAISLGIPSLVPADTWLANEAEEWQAGFMTYKPHDPKALCASFREFAANVEPMTKQSRRAAQLYRSVNGPAAVINQIGALWVPRRMAARLSLQPSLQEIALDQQQGPGFSLNETFNGTLVRWTAQAFDIRFKWSFWADWELTIRALRYIDKEQVTAAQASLVGAPVTVSTRIDGGEGLIIVSGAGRGLASPDFVVRITLPWTYKPEGETRELGVLVGAITIGPSGGLNGLSKSETTIEIASPVLWVERNRSFQLVTIASGSAMLDPWASAEFSMLVQTKGGPRAAHSVRLHVNGVPVPLRLVGNKGTEWQASADVDKSIIARGGYLTQWDLTREPEDVEIDVILADIGFRQGDTSRLRLVEASAEQFKETSNEAAPETVGEHVIPPREVTSEFPVSKVKETMPSLSGSHLKTKAVRTITFSDDSAANAKNGDPSRVLGR